jgi:diguanylate cyclase (GGDEF)-like protein
VSLDIRTLVVLLALSAVLMTVILSLGLRNGHADGRNKWTLGLGSVALAWFLIALRGLVTPVVTVAAADALMLAGLCTQVAALREFGGTRPTWRAILAPAALLFLLTLTLRHDFPAYTLVASLALSLPLLALGAFFWMLGERGMRWPVVFFYALGAVLLDLRAFAIWLGSRPDGTDLFRASGSDGVTFLTLFATTITGSFGFLEMQRGRAESGLRRLAMLDGLTELFNRRAFLDLAERELGRGRRRGQPSALLMIDIDHFKRVNDSHGHAAGDRVLAAVADAARRSLRAEDLLGRYGGEEFCALLSVSDLEQALATAERVRVAIEGLTLEGISERLTVSIGVTRCDNAGGAELDAGLQRADEALYRAKASGRNRVCAFEA